MGCASSVHVALAGHEHDIPADALKYITQMKMEDEVDLRLARSRLEEVGRPLCTFLGVGCSSGFFERYLREEALQEIITVDDVVSFFDTIPGAACETKLRALGVDGVTMMLLSVEDMCSELGIESRIIAKKVDARVSALREKGAKGVARTISNALFLLSDFYYAYLNWSFCLARASDRMLEMASTAIESIARNENSKSNIMQMLSERKLDVAMLEDKLWTALEMLNSSSSACAVLESTVNVSNPPPGSAIVELNLMLPLIGFVGKSDVKEFFDGIYETFIGVERPARESNLMYFYRAIYLNAACKSKLGFEMTN
jgi:hypothetical protein